MLFVFHVNRTQKINILIDFDNLKLILEKSKNGEKIDRRNTSPWNTRKKIKTTKSIENFVKNWSIEHK